MDMTYDEFKALVENIDANAVVEKARQAINKGKANNTQIVLLFVCMKLDKANEIMRDGKLKNDTLISALAEAMSELMELSPTAGRRVAALLDAHLPPECPQENEGPLKH